MMITKNELTKITDNLWEIPKSFRRGMRVPARIYATEKMLNEISRDRSLEQLLNLTTLPGIQQYAIAMPDAHEGYGSPIGGVFATNLQDGIISPGAIGYDINCLHPNTKISLSHGTYTTIEQICSNWRITELLILDKSSRSSLVTEIVNFFIRPERNFLYNLKTRFGFEIKTTGDHPIFTTNGMKKTESLKIGDRVVIHSFRGTIYENPNRIELVNEEKVVKALKKLRLKNNGNRWRQILNWLSSKNLLKIRTDSPILPYLIKILGYITGDGTANLIGKDRKGAISLYGTKEDLLTIQQELAEINIKSIIYFRKRNHIIKSSYQKSYQFSHNEHALRANSTAFTLLLYILGLPLGSKTSQPLYLPVWLKKSPRWQKRIFLAAFFGAKMSTPRTIKKYNFSPPTLNLNKNKSLKRNCYRFLQDIIGMVKEFDVRCSPIKEIERLGNHGKTMGLRFQIHGESENLMRFFQTIGFEYHREKQKLASLAIAYLKYKLKAVNLRKSVRAQARILYTQKVAVPVIMGQLERPFPPAQSIEHSLWSQGRYEPRIAFDFPSFGEFINQNQYGNNGFVTDEIESIEKTPYQGLVYDLTVNHSGHNFIANNFVVSNCGVRLLRSEKTFDEVKPVLEKLAQAIYKEVPSGVGRGGRLKLKGKELHQVLQKGAKRMVELGYGDSKNLEQIESNGQLPGANPDYVSDHAKSRGHDQIGTMGAGNHFVEVEVVELILDETQAKQLGLFKDQVTVLIHTGSRGMGHQIATDYIRKMVQVMPKYGITLPDRELACAPFQSPEGQQYFQAMAAAANFAWANRQLITWEVRKAWQEVLGVEDRSLVVVYDVAHNIAKVEEYDVQKTEDGRSKMEKQKLVVHRKGATRSFPSQPVLIPGSIGTGSYVLVGQPKAMDESFGSSCHGAGRRMSRAQAKREIRGDKLKQELEHRGIVIQTGSLPGLAEEAPQAYKSVDEVVSVVHDAGLAKMVARLRPIAVIKG